jgi:hypothetical protein
MAGTSETPEDSTAGPDDINNRLAEIAAELASEARFKEPSAAERARARAQAARPAAKAAKAGRRGLFRRRFAAREARREAGQAVPDRGYADATMPSRLRSGLTILIILALLIGTSIGLRYVFRHRSPAGTGGAARTTPTAPLSAPPSPSPTVAATQPQSLTPAAHAGYVLVIPLQPRGALSART